MNAPPGVSVQVGKQTVQLLLPPSFALRYEIGLAGSTNWQRAIFAALGVCWSGPGAPKVKYAGSYDPLVYGGEVLDELVARGLRPKDAWDAAATAYRFLTDSVVGEAEVADAENFSVPKPEGSIG